ncbi:MAG TPA: amino acid adenylation domain-containing protein, partial [Polyangia bacterium]|nr:amino acid adenylation domain-containing protein [Polyangia bacterium]
YQLIAPELALSLPVVDLHGAPDDEVQRRATEEARRPFDLATGPLLRVTLLRLAPDAHVLLLTMHHIISDGWSAGVLVREWLGAYRAAVTGEPARLPALPIQYADYAQWQRGWLAADGRLDAQLDYWARTLGPRPPVLELPTDHPRPAQPSFAGGQHQFRLPPSVSSWSRGQGVTPFMTLLASFALVVGRYAGQRDVIVGAPVANRDRPELEGLIGFFVNTLALRVDLAGRPTFRELVQRVRETTLAAYAHQDVPFEQVVERLAPERDRSRAPLFQVAFAMQNAPLPPLALPGLTLSPLDTHNGAANFDLTLFVVEDERGFVATLQYRRDLYEAATIARLGEHLAVLVDAALAAPDADVAALPLMTSAERTLVVDGWNDTAQPFALDRNVDALVSERAAARPDSPALVSAAERVTFGDMEARANRLARLLQSRGVGPECAVALHLDRSPALVIAELAILRAGGVYVPIDPAYPDERARWMIADAGAAIVLDAAQFAALEAEAAALPASAPASAATPENLAYIIYTSGSTGKPKGVAVRHRNLANFVAWHTSTFAVDERDRMTQLSGPSFDASALEIWSALSVGASLHFPDQETKLSPERLQAWMVHEGVTISFLATPLAEAVLALPWPRDARLRVLETGGDKLLRYANAQHPFAFYNGYGPTESTIFTTCGRVPTTPRADGAPTIGRPLANLRVYLLDGSLRPVPVGVPGELYSAGAGVARGYHRRPALTAERFIPDPFSREPGARLYKTGDLARFLPDGQIEFLGRIDSQIQIRGLRVELGEIESVLLQLPSVREACVLALDSPPPAEKRLVAYVVADGDVDVEALRVALRRQLPEYMVPASFVALDALPLTPNGKVDRRALPAPDSAASVAAFVAPRSPVEAAVARVFAAVLALPQVGATDDFFALGGHSLLATKLVNRLREAFSVDFPLRLLFEQPSVAGIAAQIVALQSSSPSSAPIPPASRDVPLPLSFTQQRFWFLAQLEPDSPFYNVPQAVQIDGQLDPALLARSLDYVVARHEILRTSFVLDDDGAPRQHIAASLSLPLAVEALAGGPQLRARLAELAAMPFDLARGPLVRVHLLQQSHDRHVLVVLMHHIVSDGWSLPIFIREVATAYDAFSRDSEPELPPLPIQYADFAVWQRAWLQGPVLDAQLDYWRAQLADCSGVLDLPTDRPRPAVQTYRGASHAFRFDSATRARLHELARATGTSPYMVLLTAFKLLLARYCRQDDLVVGTPVANRRRSEVEPLLGCFVNTLAIRTRLGGACSFREALALVRASVLGAQAHQDIPFDTLVDHLALVRDVSRTPLFQVLFVFDDGASSAPLVASGLRIAPVDVPLATTVFDLTLSLSERDDGFDGALDYNVDIFAGGTIARLAAHLTRLLAAALAAPDADVAMLPIMTPAEHTESVVRWNETAQPFPSERRLHEWVAAQSARTPDAIAVVDADEQLTYRELDARANRLARLLQRRGVGAEQLVGVCLPRRAELVVALLAVLKAGGAYVPIDQTHPPERIAFILADTRARLVITRTALRAIVAAGVESAVAADDVTPLCLDDVTDELAALPDTAPATTTVAANLAYLIYTSGSTGKPKGVAISHRSVSAFLAWSHATFAAGDWSGVLAATAVTFDLSIYELFGPLSRGGTVVLVDNALALGAAAAPVSLLNTVPSAMAELARQGALPPSVRTVNLAGEALPRALVSRLYDLGVERVHNLYGPSEDTTYSTFCLVPRDDEREPTIGRPIANTRAYVLDAHG